MLRHDTRIHQCVYRHFARVILFPYVSMCVVGKSDISGKQNCVTEAENVSASSSFPSGIYL